LDGIALGRDDARVEPSRAEDPYVSPRAAGSSEDRTGRQTRYGVLSLLLAGCSVLGLAGTVAILATSGGETPAIQAPLAGAQLLGNAVLGATVIGLPLGIAGIRRHAERRIGAAVAATIVHAAVAFLYVLSIAGWIALRT
jgi:hypothetical protein